MNERTPAEHQLISERQTLLDRLQDWLEIPMLVLAFIWLALFVVEIVQAWAALPSVMQTTVHLGAVLRAVLLSDFCTAEADRCRLRTLPCMPLLPCEVWPSGGKTAFEFPILCQHPFAVVCL